MRSVLFALALLLSVGVVAQSKFDGSWFFTGKKNSLFCVIENGKLNHYVPDKTKTNWIDKSASLPEKSQFVTSYKENRSNAVYTYMHTCEGCSWTETTTYEFFYVSPYVIYVKYTKSMNFGDMYGAENCWEPSGECYMETEYGYMTHTVYDHYLNITYSASATNGFKPLEVRQTLKNTEVKVQLTSNQSKFACTLYAPGSEKAFMIRDLKGNTYRLLGQYGFMGSDSPGGFGKRTIGQETIEFTLVFEKVPSTITTFSLIEGTCEENCWNVYDIKVK